MEIIILNASMMRDEENGFLGKVLFEVPGHKKPYEITLHSKKGREWGYALSFQQASGPDEEIDAVDAYLDEHDEAFDLIVRAAKEAMKE